jgi:energy-converting hydrogenase A subunit M
MPFLPLWIRTYKDDIVVRIDESKKLNIQNKANQDALAQERSASHTDKPF